MTQNEKSLVTTPWFEQIPFCNPAIANRDTAALIAGFDPRLGHAEVLAMIRNISGAYEAEKDPNNHQEEKQAGPGIDLTLLSHVSGMARHTVLHAITGKVEWGTSDTHCIPLWDRHAAIEGLQHVRPETATAETEIMDALSLNALRSMCQQIGRQAAQQTLETDLLTAAIPKGQRSKANYSQEQTDTLARLGIERRRNMGLYIAKLKHLAWLTDQQRQPIRNYLYPELTELVQQADGLGIDPELLTIHMGADTGASAATDRPPYFISSFAQLRHLGTSTYTLPDSACHILPMNEVLASMDRPDDSPPWYTQDARYNLPLRFDNA
ncbi:MAG TPA: hypothetical protein VMY99_01225 [Nevskiaceae bacterium]|nr:hypothetical protein [Nevskiaceae bacterium]